MRLRDDDENIPLCEDLEQLKGIRLYKVRECEECVKMGTDWVHLRTCQTCGVTLCCDSSMQRHATKHFLETGHPVVISAEPREKWAWCYKHSQIMEY